MAMSECFRTEQKYDNQWYVNYVVTRRIMREYVTQWDELGRVLFEASGDINPVLYCDEQFVTVINIIGRIGDGAYCPCCFTPEVASEATQAILEQWCMNHYGKTRMECMSEVWEYSFPTQKKLGSLTSYAKKNATKYIEKIIEKKGGHKHG